MASTCTGARVSKFIVDKDVDDNAGNGYQSAVISGGIAYSEIYGVDGMAVTAASQINGGFSRFCSSSFEQAGRFEGRGFVDDIYLTGEENDEGLFWALDTANGAIWALPGLGRGGWETAVQVDTGSMNTVGVLLMDDNTAPVYLWVGTKRRPRMPISSSAMASPPPAALSTPGCRPVRTASARAWALTECPIPPISRPWG